MDIECETEEDKRKRKWNKDEFFKNKNIKEIRKHMFELISRITSVKFLLIVVFCALFNPDKMNQPIGILPYPPGASDTL